MAPIVTHLKLNTLKKTADGCLLRKKLVRSYAGNFRLRTVSVLPRYIGEEAST